MKVFVSWSGTRGRLFAQAVYRLLAGAGLDPWMSSQIRHGRPWASELLAHLQDCEACVVCITSDTVASRWLIFEAGAVAGAGVDPGRVVGLGLDVKPGMLDGHLLARLGVHDLSAEGLRAMWQSLRPGTEPAWDDAAQHAFDAACATVPDAAPRDLTLWLTTGDALHVHAVQLDRDVDFGNVLDALLRAHELPGGDGARAALRCLDLDAGRWVPMPWRLSTVGARRLVVMTAEGVARYEGSERMATAMLRESIDVMPKVKAVLQSVQRDLRDLTAMQARFHAEHGRYAGSLPELDFIPACDNQVELVAGPSGFAAVADSGGVAYGMRVGDGAGQFRGQPEGELFLVRTL